MTASLLVCPVRPGGCGECADGCADEGMATVWAAIAVTTLVAVLVAMLGLVAAVGGRHRAAAAADLAALAAAAQAVRGEEVACDRAARAATGTGGRLVLCRVRGVEAVVEVEVALRVAVLGGVTTRSRARAGPVDQPLTGQRAPLADTGHVRAGTVRHSGLHTRHPDVEVRSQIAPSGRRRRPSGRPPRGDALPWETITCSDDRAAVIARSSLPSGRSATVAGMAGRHRAYWNLLDGSAQVGPATTMSLPSLRWGRRVPRRPPPTGSTAPRPPPAGSAPTG